MKDFQTLKILDLFSVLFKRLGVNYPLMRRILSIKFTLDGRKTPTIFNQHSKKKRKVHEENGFVKSLWIYVFYGLILIPFIGFGKNYFFQMSIFFGIVMFLVMTSMVSDFSSILLDLRDRTIFQTKPIDKRTITFAKSIHICVYLFFLTGALTGIPLIVGLIRHGILFFLLTIMELILVNLLIVVLTSIVYYFILRFFDGEKLKDMINYVQIGLTIAVTIGYQLVIRTFSLLDMNVIFSPKWWQFFILPIWFGAPFELLQKANFNPYLVVFSSLALVLPIVSFVGYYHMMPTFEQNLQKLASTSGRSKKVEKSWMPYVLCRSKEEKAFYRFANHMMRNEREFRLKVYPSLGLAIVFPFIFMMNKLQTSSFDDLASSNWYLTIYTCNIIIPTAVDMLKYSGKYKGAWIYSIVPLQNLAPLFSATLKVFIAKLFFPVYFLLSVIFIGIFGFRIVLDLLVVLVSSILYTVICSNSLKGSLPFSESFEGAQQSNSAKIILFLIVDLFFCGFHYILSFFHYGVLIYFFLLLAVTFSVWRRAYRTVWG